MMIEPAEELANIARACRTRLDLPELIGQDELTEQQTRIVLSWWHVATGGLQFSDGWVGTVGVRAYHWLRARSGAAARGIDGVTRIDNPLVAAMTRTLALHLDWIDPDAFPPHDMASHIEQTGLVTVFLTELDVNGQFLAAAGCELGTGEPDLITRPRTLGAYLTMPGYVRLSEKPALDGIVPVNGNIPPLSCPRAFDRLEAGSAITMTTARYLSTRGAELDADEVVIWPRHRRHLAAWQTRFRTARSSLALEAAEGNRGALIALALVKEVANVTVGGWMRSEDKNHSDLMRKDWSDQIISEGVVRALIAVDKAAAAGNPAIGMRRDAAWFLGPINLEPEGLEIDKTLWNTGRDGQLGKWKRTRSLPVDKTMIEAIRSGSPERVVRVLTAWEREHGKAT